MNNDGRKRLRAHWPPRRRNAVQVELPADLYAEVWLSADAEEWSLAEEIRARLRHSYMTEERIPVAGRAADRQPGDVDRPAGAPAAREAKS